MGLILTLIRSFEYKFRMKFILPWRALISSLTSFMCLISYNKKFLYKYNNQIRKFSIGYTMTRLFIDKAKMVGNFWSIWLAIYPKVVDGDSKNKNTTQKVSQKQPYMNSLRPNFKCLSLAWHEVKRNKSRLLTFCGFTIKDVYNSLS